MAKDNNLRYEERKVINEHFHRYEGVEQKSKTLPYLILEGEAKGNNELDFPNTSRNQGTNSKAERKQVLLRTVWIPVGGLFFFRSVFQALNIWTAFPRNQYVVTLSLGVIPSWSEAKIRPTGVCFCNTEREHDNRHGMKEDVFNTRLPKTKRSRWSRTFSR